MRNLLSAPPTERVGRYPKHPWLVQSKPYTLQPVMLARVLPGETLKSLKFESRIVTSPVVNPIIGWKQEFVFFYVKITDLALESLKEMFVDPEVGDLTSTMGEGANRPVWYTAKGGINWLQRCTTVICDHFFRDTGEVTADHVLASGLPIVQIRNQNFMDSLTDKDLMPNDDAVEDAMQLGDLERLMTLFEDMRAMGLAPMTYEDFLRSNGIRVPEPNEGKPELLCRFSDFQYPSNTIDPATGAPSSALSWVFNTGNRDPKRFKEPGFVVGYSITRPKVYFGGLAGSASGFAGRSWDWMVNYVRGMPETQLKRFALDTGPLGERATNADGYWLDMRDELLYGDQFQNVAAFGNDPISLAASHILPLPAGTDIDWKYPTEAMIDGFFKDGAGGFIRQDGYAQFGIKGFEVDYTQQPQIAEI